MWTIQFINVTGYGIIYGLTTAIDTLSSQVTEYNTADQFTLLTITVS